MMGYGPMAGFGFGWLGMLIGAIFWIALLVLVIWGISRVLTSQRGVEVDSPLEILKRRCARGEITEVEYEQARKALA